jgi:hypothetical protein
VDFIEHLIAQSGEIDLVDLSTEGWVKLLNSEVLERGGSIGLFDKGGHCGGLARCKIGLLSVNLKTSTAFRKEYFKCKRQSRYLKF